MATSSESTTVSIIMDTVTTAGETVSVTNITAKPECMFACTSEMFSPGAITGVVVVALVILALVIVRWATCVKAGRRCPGLRGDRDRCPGRLGCPWCLPRPRPAVRRPRCCSYCLRTNAVSSVGSLDSSPRPALEDPDLPPGYEEVIGTMRYNRKKTVAKATATEPAISGDPPLPPSYDRIEKGEFSTTAVTEKSAVQRLRQAIMSKSRTCLVEHGDRQENQHVDRHDVSGSQHETVVEINCVSTPGGDYRDVSIQTADLSLDDGGLGLQGTWSRSALARHGPGNKQATVSRNGSNASSWTIPSYSALVHPPAYDNLSFCMDETVTVASSGDTSGARGVHRQVPEIHVVMINTPTDMGGPSSDVQHASDSQQLGKDDREGRGLKRHLAPPPIESHISCARPCSRPPLEPHVSCGRALCRRESERLCKKIQVRSQLRRSASLSRLYEARADSEVSTGLSQARSSEDLPGHEQSIL